MNRSTERLFFAAFFILFLGGHHWSMLSNVMEPHRGTADIQSDTMQPPGKDTMASDKWSLVMDGLRPAIGPYRATARAKLMAGRNTSCTTPRCHFDDIQPFVPLAPPLIWKGDGEADKTMMDPSLTNKDDCILYGIGIHTDSTFEQAMAPFCNVHAFDCTITHEQESVKGKDFTFHQLCIGEEEALKGTNWGFGDAKTHMKFKTLMQAMKDLGHSRIDYLKFDTEGSEWTIFESILALPKERLPRQLNFEMHTQGAAKHAVPETLVLGKTRGAVNDIMLRFMDVGYGILDFQPNKWDGACAELTLILL
jgi:hypothetical protein